MSHIPIKLYNLSSNPPRDALQVTFTVGTTYTIDSKWKSMDVFLVGGGAGGTLNGGGYYSGSTWCINGASGGGAGYTNTQRQIDVSINKELTINIGNGGTGGHIDVGTNGGASSITINNNTITANGGTTGTYIQPYYYGGYGGSAGGYGNIATNIDESTVAESGASNGGNSSKVSGNYGKGQGTTTKAFGETDEALYAGGGGTGGGCYGESGNRFNFGANGGDGGGGHGATTQTGTFDKNGKANTGGGGGGAGYGNYYSSHRNSAAGGNGGSGIVIIRLYKSSDRPTDIDWSENSITINQS